MLRLMPVSLVVGCLGDYKYNVMRYLYLNATSKSEERSRVKVNFHAARVCERSVGLLNSIHGSRDADYLFFQTGRGARKMVESD
ncbi:hypothetical protein ACTXT7_006365 [Hymenolepis weldensis]